MKKVVLKLELNDEKSRRKAAEAVSTLLGVYEIDLDMKEKKLTVTGNIDPVKVVSKLEKVCCARLVSVERVAKEEEKKKKKADDTDNHGNISQQPPIYIPSSWLYPPYAYPPTTSAPPYFTTTPEAYPNYGYNYNNNYNNWPYY